MSAFWLSLGMIFMLELGDKTQLVALSLATKFNARVVLAGVFVATLMVHVVSVALGGGVGKIVPEAWIRFLSGLAFIGFGIWTVRGDDAGDEEVRSAKSPFWIVAITFFLAELGDKTMIGTVTLATNHSMLPVWLGSTLGMVLSDGLAILLGQQLGARLPERPIKIGAACVFFAFGLFGAISGGLKLPLAAWAIGAFLLAAFAHVLYRGLPFVARPAAVVDSEE